MTNIPQTLYHYTSLETLALILTNKSLCFNTLLNVDDIEEAETSDMGLLGKYVYVSCWTDEAAESIPMWQLYTPNMHGVRIQLPIFPFKEHHYKAGELHFKENTTSYIDLKKMFDDNKASICGNFPELVQITYTTDKTLLHPRTKFGDSLDDFKSVLGNGSTGKQQSKTTIRFKELGRYKNVDWQFQKEWRYWLFMAPLGIGTSSQITPKTTVDLYSLLQDKDARPPYERFFVDLSEEAISQMQIVFGPRMTEAEKILAKHLLRGSGLDGKWKESALRIR